MEMHQHSERESGARATTATQTAAKTFNEVFGEIFGELQRIYACYNLKEVGEWLKQERLE